MWILSWLFWSDEEKNDYEIIHFPLSNSWLVKYKWSFLRRKYRSWIIETVWRYWKETELYLADSFNSIEECDKFITLHKEQYNKDLQIIYKR